MSKGLGKWERYVLDFLTSFEDEYEDPQIIETMPVKDLIAIYLQYGDKEFTPFVIEHIPSKDLTPEQISISQSLMRAICSLEKKGIITSRIEPTERDEDGNRMNVGGKYIDLIDLYAKKNRPLVAKYHYLRKCLVKLSHRQKYLNKRLEEIEAIKNG